eukprot:15244279-Ditylum_brightwellii.AAC.1
MLFGEDLTTQFAMAFINGQVDVAKYHGIPKELQHILHELSPKPTDPPQIDVYITPDQIMRGFKIWKEQTLTSPSGLHLSSYKIWLQKTEDKDIMTAKEFFSSTQNFSMVP